jgi:hypothetical protein
MKKPKALGIKRRITILDRMDAVKRLQSVGEERKAQLLHRSTKDEIDRLRGVLHHTRPTNSRAVIEHLAHLNHELSKMKQYK